MFSPLKTALIEGWLPSGGGAMPSSRVNKRGAGMLLII